jgi:hypothetical protein
MSAEWIARVSILDGRRWHTTTWKPNRKTPGAAAREVIKAAKAKLPKYTHVDEIMVKLTRVPAAPKGEQS